MPSPNDSVPHDDTQAQSCGLRDSSPLMWKRLESLGVFIACLYFFLALSLPRIHDLMGQDEASHYFKLTRLLLEKGWSKPDELITFSPHGYPLFNLLVCKQLRKLSMFEDSDFVVYDAPSYRAQQAKIKHNRHRLQTTVRLSGILLWLITLLVVSFADKSYLAAPLLCIFPAVCQAAVIVEIDQTALPLTCLCLCLAFNRLRTHGGWTSFMLATLALSAALWCRLTTPLILCAPLLLLSPQWGVLGAKALSPALHQDSEAPGPAPYPALHQDRGAPGPATYPALHQDGGARGAKAPRPLPSVWQSQRATLRTLTAMLAGALLFLLTWWLYCTATGVSFSGPFRYLVTSFAETTVGKRAGGLSFYAQNLIYLCLWGFNPFLILLFIADGIRRIKRWRQTKAIGNGDSYWLCAATLLVGYTFVGGALFGFPKYQIPALPLMALAISDFIDLDQLEDITKKTPFTWMLGISAVAIFFTPDLLYIIRRTWRVSKAMGIPAKWGLNFPLFTAPLLVAVVVALLLFYIFVCQKNHNCPRTLLLLACAIGCNFTWTICQSYSPSISTGYIYGDKGECDELALLILDKWWVEDTQCVPVEVVQCLGLYDTQGMRPQDAPDAESLAARIQRTSPPVVALSPLIQPVEQYRAMVESPILQQALADYEKHINGHLTIWIKRSVSPKDLYPDPRLLGFNHSVSPMGRFAELSRRNKP